VCTAPLPQQRACCTESKSRPVSVFCRDYHEYRYACWDFILAAQECPEQAFTDGSLSQGAVPGHGSKRPLSLTLVRLLPVPCSSFHRQQSERFPLASQGVLFTSLCVFRKAFLDQGGDYSRRCSRRLHHWWDGWLVTCGSF
jgi:hypothetical protein